MINRIASELKMGKRQKVSGEPLNHDQPTALSTQERQLSTRNLIIPIG
jgi:hypothetical protein